MYDFFVYRFKEVHSYGRTLRILEFQSTCSTTEPMFKPPNKGSEIFETREEAEAERNRLNSKYGLD
jgi:hypothetical protein